jgi:hypothetical protein
MVTWLFYVPGYGGCAQSCPLLYNAGYIEYFLLFQPETFSIVQAPYVWFHSRNAKCFGRGFVVVTSHSASKGRQQCFVSLIFCRPKQLSAYDWHHSSHHSIVKYQMRITITILDIIDSPAFHLKHNGSETGFCVRAQRLALFISPNWVGSAWRRGENSVNETSCLK